MTAPRGSAVRCSTCQLKAAYMSDEERRHYGLPLFVCKCAVKAVRDEMLARGFAPIIPTDVGTLNTAGVVLKTAPAEFVATARENSVEFARYAPTWARAVLSNPTLSASVRVALLKRLVREPERAAVAVAVLAAGGSGALFEFLFRDLGAPDDGAPPTVAGSGR